MEATSTLPTGRSIRRSGFTRGSVKRSTACPSGLRKSARTSGITTRSRNAITASVSSAFRMKSIAVMV